MSRTRRHFTADQKAQIVRRHLSGKEPVSALADEFGLQPTQIHTWVNQVIAHAEKALERSASNGRVDNAKDRKIETLQAKLAQKNEVIAPHEHWHVDISCINVQGTFYYLTSILDGASRFIVHWELRESMTERDVETIVQRALEKQPGEKPRIISDNGPRFIARDFKEFIRIVGITHVRTSPYYPQSNGKLERWHGSLKQECVRPACPASLEEARSRVAAFVTHYNHVRLHSAIGYITPADKLNGLEDVIFAERDRKLEKARTRRQQTRKAAKDVA